MDMRFHVTRKGLEELDWESQEIVEGWADGEFSIRGARHIMSQFMVDEQGHPLSEKEAAKTIWKLRGETAKDAVARFVEAVKQVAVPPTIPPPSLASVSTGVAGPVGSGDSLPPANGELPPIEITPAP